MKARRFVSALLFAAALGGCEATPPPATPADLYGPPEKPAPVAPPSISAERMSEITRVLASDEFQGRSMGTPGEEKTVAYLTEQFRVAGLEPGGENGGWTQTVPMIRTKLQTPMSLSVEQGSRTLPLRFPDDVYLSTVRDTERAKIANAPMVFVGYGVTAPERGWDDFKGVDLKGKVAVFLVNDPDFEAAAGDSVAGKFGGQTMTYYGRWTYKFDEAARRGAIAALIVHDTPGAGYGWNVVESAAGENFNIVLPADAQQPVLLQGWVRGPVADELFKRSGHDLAEMRRKARTAEFKPVDLKARFSANAGVELNRITSRNVIGKLTNLPRLRRSDQSGSTSRVEPWTQCAPYRPLSRLWPHSGSGHPSNLARRSCGVEYVRPVAAYRLIRFRFRASICKGGGGRRPTGSKSSGIGPTYSLTIR